MTRTLERLAAPYRFERLIATNIAIKGASDVVVKAARFLLVLAAARLLGPADFGLFSLAFAVGSMLAVVSDLGLNLHLAREVALGERSPAESLGEAVSGKLLMSGLVLLALGAAFALYPRPASVKWLLVLAGVYMLCLSWCELWNHLFRGLQSLRQEAVLNVFGTLLAAAAGLAVLLWGHGPHALYGVLLATAVVANLAALRLVRERGLLPAGLGVRAAFHAMRRAYPAGVAIVLSMIYFRIDLVLLERMRDDAEVGAYAAAYRLLEGLLFVPAFFMAAIYPALSGASRRDSGELDTLLRVGLRWMFLLASAFAMGFLVAAPWALLILYGAPYAEAASVLRVLAPALVFIFPNYLLTHMLVAMGRQRTNAVIAGVCVVVNVALNLPAIHRFGALGAAMTTVVTEAVLFALAAYAVSRGRQPRAQASR